MATAKFIEMDISASGFGCVNTNGNINPRTGNNKSEDGFENKIYPKSRGGQLYISNNSIRSYLFEDDARGFMLASKVGFQDNKAIEGVLTLTKKDTPEISQLIASSYLGLLRGYMLTEKGGESIKRKSPLTITDFINHSDLPPNKNEVMVNHNAVDDDGKKESNSLFYAETWGDTVYSAKAIINIENLQFISTDSRLGHREVDFGANPKKDNVEDSISSFKDKLISSICEIAKARNWDASKVGAHFGRFEKKGTLLKFPEEGFLLNEHAIRILIKETIARIQELQIVKSKGFMKVDDVSVKFSSSLGKYLDEESADTVEFECFYTEYGV